MDYVIVIAAVYWVTITAQTFIEAPKWAWYVFMAALSSGAMALISPDQWWWGLGVPTFVIVLSRFDDLLLSAGDACRVSVLRTTRK